jgi:hypothetical protein
MDSKCRGTSGAQLRVGTKTPMGNLANEFTFLIQSMNQPPEMIEGGCDFVFILRPAFAR